MQYEKLFRSQSVWKSIFSMAVPAVIVILVMIVYNMTDMFFIGRLGDYTMVASISIASPVFSLASAVATMLGSGGSALVAKELGRDQKDQARIYASLCFWGSIVIGVLIGAAVLAGADVLLPLLGAAEDTYAYTKSYICVCAAGMPFMLVSMAMGSVIRSEGAIKEGMIGNLGANGINMILDPVFIFGLGWNVAGAAAATVISNVCATIYYLIYMRKKAIVLNAQPSLSLKQPAALFSIMFLGLPSALSTLLSGFASTFSNRLLAGYGTDAVAAMAAAGKTSMVIGMLQIGICMGIQPLLAFHYGAKDMPRLHETMKKTGLLTVIVGAVSGIFCYFGRAQVVALFLTDAAAAALAEDMVVWLVVASPIVGLIYLSTNFMQASGRAAPATFISLLRQGLLLIPLMVLCNAVLGLTGIAAAHMAADVLSAIVSVMFMLWHDRRISRTLSE